MVDVGRDTCGIEDYHRLVQRLSTCEQALLLAEGEDQIKKVKSEKRQIETALAKARSNLQ